MSESGWLIDAEFPGGNIIVERTGTDSADIRQDLRDTVGWWFWWQFRVRGAQGRGLTFRHTGRKPGKRFPFGRLGPAVSVDGGLSWSWLGAEAVETTETVGQFRYAFAPGDSEVRFAFAPPYVATDLERFLTPRRGHAHLEIGELCRSRKGRSVPRLRVGCLAGAPAVRVLMTARHHACESQAGFVLEGVMEAALDAPDLAPWFQRHVELMILPFMDADGVEEGDQGKNRAPRDHGRDYEGESLYPEARAVRALAPVWGDGRLRAAVDVHCPAMRDRVIQIIGNPRPEMWEMQSRFGRILESSIAGPLPYDAADNLPFGQAWNVDTNFEAGKSFSRWASELPGMALAAGMEFPYADVKGIPVTAAAARLFGRDLARALRTCIVEMGFAPGWKREAKS